MRVYHQHKNEYLNLKNMHNLLVHAGIVPQVISAIQVITLLVLIENPMRHSIFNVSIKMKESLLIVVLLFDDRTGLSHGTAVITIT